MKNVRSICVLLALGFYPVMAGGPPSTGVLSAEPLRMELTYENSKIKREDHQSGVKLVFQLFLDERYGISIDENEINQNKTITAVDSTGKKLEGFLYADIKEEERGQSDDEIQIQVSFSGLPSKNARWIKLTGIMPMDVFSEKKETEIKDITGSLNKNEDAKNEDIKIGGIVLGAIKDDERERVSYQFWYKGEKAPVKLRQINFHHEDGSLIKPSYTRHFSYNNPEKWIGRYTAEFNGSIFDKLNVSVSYWGSCVRHEYPLDLIFYLSNKGNEGER